MTNGGAGILVHFPGGQKALASMAVGKHCSSYRAETEAIIQAASVVQASDHDCKQVVFLSDALSVLQAYQNHKLPNLTKALQQVAATRRAVLQWIPAHCGISGNEQADILAKEDARGEQHANNVNFNEKKTLIRALTMPRSQRDDYHLMSQEQQVILVRLCIEHNRLNSHMQGKLKLTSSPTCPVVKMTKPQSYKRRCVACQHSPDDQTLRLQAGAGEDDVIHLPSGLDRVDCERQEEDKFKSCQQNQFSIPVPNECLQLTYACVMSVSFTNSGYSLPSYPMQIYFPKHVYDFSAFFPLLVLSGAASLF